MAWWNRKKSEVPKQIEVSEEAPVEAESNMSQYIGDGAVGYNPIYYDVFDGEKTPGELGAVYDTLPDHLRLRLRAYDLNLKTDIIKIITGKFFKWVVGTGLKLQAEPNETVLKISGITEDLTKMREHSESLFNLYAASKYSDYHSKDWLHKKASEAFKAAFLGGDCLCIIRINKFGPNIQVVDGQQIETPFDDEGKGKGNVIKKGIEMNKKGEHIAFWMVVDDEDSVKTHIRVKAKNSNGNLVAWMIYGEKHRIDHHRGIPVISSILEKVSKLDRFVEASTSKAEQTANVVYAFKHDNNSTGVNILTQNLTGKNDSENDKESSESAYEKNGRSAHMLRQSTSGSVMNLTPGSDLISLDSPSQTHFNEFFRAVFVCLCAAVDIPEEVALQKYEQNYSSSRAAINGWEFIIEIYRQEFAKKFYEPFYRVWFEYQILTEKIKSTSFLKAKAEGDFMAIEAYFSARFTGKKMPHIDPAKEAKAVRTMLGDNTAALISLEQATELLGGGDWVENYKKYLKEQELIPIENDNNQNGQQGNSLES